MMMSLRVPTIDCQAQPSAEAENQTSTQGDARAPRSRQTKTRWDGSLAMTKRVPNGMSELQAAAPSKGGPPASGGARQAGGWVASATAAARARFSCTAAVQAPIWPAVVAASLR